MEMEKTKSAGYLANHMARLFASGLQARIKPLGLAPAQFMTLLELWNRDGLTQKELVVLLDVEQATMANTIRRMERDGLIERKAHPKDGRAQSIFLTEKARQVEADAVIAAKTQNAEALEGLAHAERTQFLDLMSRVITNMRDRASEKS
ncbi:MAG: MarR family transcriptional regulator [Rhodobacteraceae bacterium]|nr:MarR family transcriptional regulator [Paracoccaceae bacterium]